MSPDPVSGKLTNPQTWNSYVYANNNPVNVTDPTGLDPDVAAESAGDDDGVAGSSGGGGGPTGADILSDPAAYIPDYTADSGAGSPGPAGNGLGAIMGTGAANNITAGNDIFDAIVGAPGTQTSIDSQGNFSWGWSVSQWKGYYAAQTTVQYSFTDQNGNAFSNQKTIDATAFGQEACSGMGASIVASCIQQTYNSMGDSVNFVGGHDNFDYSNISIMVNGENIDTKPADFVGCLGSRCGVFNSLDFSHPGTTFHVDMANVYFFPVGTLVHGIADVLGGHTWWKGGVPPFPLP